MKSKAIVILAAALMLALGLGVIASNMGFKVTTTLTAGYNNWVGLPYNVSYANAGDVYTDAGASQVSRWDNATSGFVSYTGRGTPFNLITGEAILMKVTATKDWVVVGSHDPAASITVTAGYNNWLAVPYHTTCANAGDLYTEIGASQVSRWDNATSGFVSYTGRGTPFNLTTAEGLLVKVTATKAWNPSHY